MTEQGGGVETSLHVHAKEAATASTTNPENDLKTTEQIIYTW